MNVFEDLIVELKEQNLLEKTVIDLESEAAERSGGHFARHTEPSAFEDPPDALALAVEAAADFVSNDGTEVEVVDETEGVQSDKAVPEPATSNEPAKGGKEFFKKQAVNEVSGLQMVEHVLTGVEREYMKIVPKPFDDLNVKKALHALLNIPQEPESTEYKSAEQALMQETEMWCMALTERDRNIGVANLRRYCENSRPALSSQALLALARFYRNSPYSEAVRAKFDFVITRLFSRSAPDDKRVCLFKRTETIGHINTLYSDWSSVSIYTADDDESNVLLTGLSFDDLAAEAEAASNFDQLIASDFFSRLRLFKESISELFYAPSVTAAAIESNIRIGNAYVKLIDSERRKLDAASIESKYGDLDHQGFSDVTGRTLDLAELMRQRQMDADEDADRDTAAAEVAAVETPTDVERIHDPRPDGTVKESPVHPLVARLAGSVKNVNKWLIVAAVLMVFLTIGLYVWADYFAEEKVSNTGVQQVELDPATFGEFIKTGKISGDTFYGVLQPTWDAMPKERRQEFLQKVLDAGKEKGFRQVTLINKDGKNAGFASPNRIEAIMP